MLIRFFLLFLFMSIESAPHVGTTTSSFLNSQDKQFFSPQGFSISAKNTNWNFAKKQKNNSIIVAYTPPEGFEKTAHAMLTVRIDELGKRYSIKSYFKRWIKDYPKLGFQVLRAKKVKVGENKAYLLDLKHQKSAKSLRQVLMVKGRKAAILTCRSEEALFSKYIKDCNSIFKNFSWTRSINKNKI